MNLVHSSLVLVFPALVYFLNLRLFPGVGMGF